MSEYLFTVFTPIFNRKHTIHRVWESLNKQTYKNFEWLIVNDGSQDGIEPLLQSYKEQATFPVRIFNQENSGKHVAFNRAVSKARGELIVPADSDDSFLPNTLEVFEKYWKLYGDKDVAGVSVLCLNEDNLVVGDKFPIEGLSNFVEMVFKHKVRGEKWGCTRTDVMKDYKFPEMSGSFFPESYVWSQIALKYQTVYVNIPLRKYYQDAGNQIMKNKTPSRQTLEIRNYYYLWWINEFWPRAKKRIPTLDLVKRYVSLWKFSFLLRKSPSSVLSEINGRKNKIFAALLLVPSFFYVRFID